MSREAKRIAASPEGLIEGKGGLECIDTSHPDQVYLARNMEELNEHYLDGKHMMSGTAPCGRCGKSVDFENIPHGNKPFCEECKEQLRKELA